ncbi:MAG: DOPA 4,5-dioxygenase family protein [Allosphingosinicella sp.]
MTRDDSPWHGHIYYSAEQRHAAEALRQRFTGQTRAGCEPHIIFIGRMMDKGVGPHPIAQYEVHFRERSLDAVIALIEAAGLRALVHPLTDDDLADHTTEGRWVGEPLDLDLTVLDPPGKNQGIARFGKTDF